MAEPILELVEVSASYGKIKALKEISLKVYPGEIVAMIGANGAGKSTTLMAICGIVPVQAGTIVYAGTPITTISAERLPVMGLCQVPEGRRIFPRLSVKENLILGGFYRTDKSAIDADIERVFSYFPVLKERLNQQGGTLSGGEQQILAIGRALMSRPKLLLLDEPSLGLAPMIVQKIFDIISEINTQEGVTILLVEQNANLALQASSRGYVLETGAVTMADTADALLANPKIRAAYLGE
ncbi:MAG: ABC transporter ATP-binding protein [Desulfofustis sp. PB-SRB1]|jgi:branched-chain amino acid transport system ATP-binding protein|nr:ABC transporter ATP-binding protein [Desulfofustis sp. PB-SRB1]MBM1001467.1 ABC transporter ATP-binding protein [Desulfofustis sp. PB-SRB1]HBH28155.1 ABC transporter ATP-binding protein [Desulfofustis sp.]HBH30722.1 ABC transporter ATP-binding protein [Desulfofustis sp.]